MGSESPSLRAPAGRDVRAYEVKFLLTEPEATELEDRLRGRLLYDPHADPTLGNAYRVTSLYFDTPRFDVYRRSDGYRRHKYRLRRYGAAPTLFLERKSKRGERVWKRRTMVPLDEVAMLDGPPPADWPGAWYAQDLAARGLRPACRVTYDRVAFVGGAEDGPVRVTLDRAARGLPAAEPTVGPFVGGLPLLCGEVIAEFKFLDAMPALFKGLIEAMRLEPRSASKYRRCVEAAGLVRAGDAAHA